MIITAEDTTRVRNAKRITTRLVMDAVPLVEVAHAEIQTTPIFPAAQYNVTNTVNWSETSPGLAFAVKDTDGNIVTWGVQRRASTSLAFYPDVKSLGDGGYGRDVAKPILAGYTMHVYQHRPVWGLLSRATTEGALKKWDFPFSGEGIRPEPLCNMGTHQQAWAGDDGVARFTLDASASYDWFGNEQSITAYAWTLPAEAHLVSGAVSDATLAIDLPAGLHQIACTVTGVTGRSATGYRWYFVHDDGDNAPLSSRYGIDITGDVSKRQGREVTFSIDGDLRDTLYPGALVLFKHETLYDGVTIDGATETYVGYVDEVSASIQRNRRTTTIKTFGPMLMASRIPTATQLIQESIDPTDWTQVVPRLNHPGFVLFYLLKYHSTILDSHDFTFKPDVTTLRRMAYGFRQLNIAAQAKQLEDIAVGEVNCRSDGTIRLFREPNHMSAEYKNALDTKFTWTEDDLAPDIALAPSLRPQAAQVIRDGLEYTGTETPLAYRAIAPGYAQGQGLSKPDLPDITIAPGGGQAELNDIVGHSLAYQNNPLASLTLTPATMLDILEPADDDWHIISVNTSYLSFDPDRFGVNWQSIKVRPTSVRRAWSRGRGGYVYRISAECRALSNGLPGSALDTSKFAGTHWRDESGWLPDDISEDIYNDDMPELGLDETYAAAVAWDDKGEIGVTETFLNEIVRWRNARGQTLTGDVLDVDWNYNLGGGAVIVLTKDGDQLKYWSNGDIFQEGTTWANTHNITIDETFVTARLKMSKTDLAALRVIAWMTTDGIYEQRYQIGPDAWTATQVIGGTFTATEDVTGSRLGLDIDGTTIYCTGKSGADTYNLYTASGYAGAWSGVANHPGDALASIAPVAMVLRSMSDTFLTYDLSDDNPAVTDITSFPNKAYRYGPIIMSNADAAAGETVRYGADVRQQTDEQESGTSYTVTELTATFTSEHWYPATAGTVGGTPDLFPPVGLFGYEGWKVECEAQVTLLDKSFNILWSSGLRQWHSLDLDESYVITYAPSPIAADRVRFTITITVNHTFTTPLEGVRYVDMEFRSVNAETFGGTGEFGTGLPYFSLTGSVNPMTISNKVNEGARLYKLDDATVTWADITPTNDRAPFHPQGLAINASTLRTVSRDSTGKQELLKSINTGGDWSSGRVTRYRWIKHLINDVYLAGGLYKLDLLDGSTALPRMGDWNSTVAAAQNFEGCLLQVESL